MKYLLMSTNRYFDLSEYEENLKEFNIKKIGNLNNSVKERKYPIIEINSIEELRNLVEKVGDIIITDEDCWTDEHLQVIEIYDEYRE